MESGKVICLNSTRRFGVELEINSFDRRNFKLYPLDKITKELPEGIDEVGDLVARAVGENVAIKTWHSTHNNTGWIVKPDSSCGMEICSPPKKGWLGIRSICRVIDAIARENVPVDNSCSLHVHLDMEDCDIETIASVVAWWIKCEYVLLAAFPFQRKRNRYCQHIGMCDLFEHNSPMDPDYILKKMGVSKYYTINSYHLVRGDRKTLEARISGKDACLDSYLAKNWIKLILHFVDCCLLRGMPSSYQKGNRWSSYLWLEPEDVFSFLGFDGSLSPGLAQTREWFLASMIHKFKEGVFPGMWNPVITRFSREQAEKMCQRYGLNTSNIESYLWPNSDAVYSCEYKD